MSMLCLALCLVLGPRSTDATIRVDWSAAAGTDSPIADVRRDYITAINARDRRADAFYASDAVAALTSGSIVTGAPALAGRLRTALEQDTAGGVTITLTPTRFMIDGATGSEIGTFTETRPDLTGSHSVEGVYVTIYSRGADGQWRIAMEARTTGSRPPLAIW
ncbi:MAG: nuclear transport factor 2 family protein [Acidobacteria bacterium]|nr:nuclear transport factor 2 family protein [Acidobacteriota bacterium]